VKTLVKTVIKSDFYPISQLTDLLKDTIDEPPDWLNTRWVGRAMIRLGLAAQKRRVKRGVEVNLTPTQVEKVAYSLGMNVEEIRREDEPPPQEAETEPKTEQYEEQRHLTDEM